MNDITWSMTDSVSITKIPPAITSSNSCFDSSANNAKAEPNDNDPTSPIKISAGWALNHKNPSTDPMSAPAMTVISGTLVNGICK